MAGLRSGAAARRWTTRIAALLVVLLTARLGWWQLDRARQKIDWQASVVSRQALAPLAPVELAWDADAAPAQHHRRIALPGRWLTDHTVYLDNRAWSGRAGFIVVTPLLLPDGRAIVVQRGWSPRHATERTRLAPLLTPAGDVVVSGRIAPPPSRLYAFDETDTGVIRQNLDLPRFAREIRVTLAPVTLMQLDSSDLAPDGLLRQWPVPTIDVGKHYGYAFQWFALCALTIALYVWFLHLRPRRLARPR